MLLIIPVRLLRLLLSIVLRLLIIILLIIRLRSFLLIIIIIRIIAGFLLLSFLLLLGLFFFYPSPLRGLLPGGAPTAPAGAGARRGRAECVGAPEGSAAARAERRLRGVTS